MEFGSSAQFQRMKKGCSLCSWVFKCHLRMKTMKALAVQQEEEEGTRKTVCSLKSVQFFFTLKPTCSFQTLPFSILWNLHSWFFSCVIFLVLSTERHKNPSAQSCSFFKLHQAKPLNSIHFILLHGIFRRQLWSFHDFLVSVIWCSLHADKNGCLLVGQKPPFMHKKVCVSWGIFLPSFSFPLFFFLFSPEFFR